MNLPRTSFPLNPPPVSPEQAAQEASALYAWQGGQAREKLFVLHDGPPFANGRLHMGHAVNKILKDIVLRYKILKGFRVNYVPGWDCHGLPIELKAVEQVEHTNHSVHPQEIRKRANAFADAAIEQQKEEFQSWGVVGDWNNAYKTKDPEYEAAQLGLFMKLYQKGYIYRSLKPVLWSPSSRTALAEAEIEYVDNHTSRSAFVALPLHLIAQEAAVLRELGDLSLLVWTTTPWTIPANKVELNLVIAGSIDCTVGGLCQPKQSL